MRKGLIASLDQGNDIIIMAMTWTSMLNIISLEKLNIELAIVPDFRPFLALHNHSVHPLYHSVTVAVLQDIALFDEAATLSDASARSSVSGSVDCINLHSLNVKRR